ncbi:MAG: SDR family NAD(P)-dependent oxidoreductase [Gammaproteobacteria bacterium]|jgi:NADP-dependent 3-hydroxy acid dehydrogenase YdfG|nr:SDR family NAD(P)-dependent oxidoreductase [Gammaproteobacteria bacterium]MDB4043321.1 SDR family NAD(P)-dependent oxidoreductase [Gammaproteobacteria bacterium]MDG0965972.1 SDR family NAD(P)-dependent oxidoreductase [SAR86 cluster bacterium]|tara:strand:- start:330 stop:1094 length:765 start_codon:yes stop_codon:yes gene_type:complete
MKPVCLVLGAGAGIGGTVAAKFASEGYHACLCRRSDQEGLDKLVANIEEQGGTANGYLIDAIEENSLEELILKVEKDIGPIEVLVYNLGAQSGMKLLHETSLKEFEWGWRMADLGLFRVAKVLMPIMEERKSGTFLVTSATAAMRGNKNQHSHAAAMGGRRMLCQTLNAEFASKGIHVAHIVVDGMVDAPDTLGKMLGEKMFNELREKVGMENDGLILPERIAETYFHLAQQHRSAWTHEVDIRAFSDSAWWND